MADLMSTRDVPMDDGIDLDEDGDQEPIAAEIEAWEHAKVFALDDRLTPDEFPRLFNESVGMTKRTIIRPLRPQRPEFVTITLSQPRVRNDESLRRSLAVHDWNQLWESAQFRRRFFDEENDLTPDLAKIADRGDCSDDPRTQWRWRSPTATRSNTTEAQDLRHCDVPDMHGLR